MALVWSATLWVASLVFAGLIGGLWFLLAADSARSATPPAAVLALTAVGIAWQQSRARARRRLQGALDAYAEREIARSVQRRQNHRTAASAAKALPARDQRSAGTRLDEDHVAQTSWAGFGQA
jgi:hypothetical protein